MASKKNTVVHIPKLENMDAQFWDPLPMETTEEHALFDAWRHDILGLSDFARARDLSPSFVWEVAARNQWKDRRTAWHTWQNAIERQAFARAAKRYARKAFAQREELDILDGLRLLIQSSVDGLLMKGTKLTPAEINALTKTAIQARQIVEHEATEVVKVLDPARLKASSTEDLEALHDALSKLD